MQPLRLFFFPPVQKTRIRLNCQQTLSVMTLFILYKALFGDAQFHLFSGDRHFGISKSDFKYLTPKSFLIIFTVYLNYLK